jgi:UDP-3-O-[3-hydroxymyristoyl] glucosamine N-acyltransferase
VVEDPRLAIQRLVREMYPPEPIRWGVDPTAHVGAGARWAGRLALAASAVLGDRATLGEDCVIGAGAMVGAGACLGDRCRIEPHAFLAPGTIAGDDVLIRTGARVGGRGFGYARLDGHHQPMEHVGGCILGNGVEIGANSTVDRGSLGDTIVAAGTKIDNLVHIGHNVRIGERCLIMAQVGVAGSTQVADDVMLAGQAGLADHVTVGQGARVGAQSGVIGDIAPGATVSGYPARPHREVLRQTAALRRLTPLVDRLERLARGESDDR